MCHSPHACPHNPPQGAARNRVTSVQVPTQLFLIIIVSRTKSPRDANQECDPFHKPDALITALMRVAQCRGNRGPRPGFELSHLVSEHTGSAGDLVGFIPTLSFLQESSSVDPEGLLETA